MMRIIICSRRIWARDPIRHQRTNQSSRQSSSRSTWNHWFGIRHKVYTSDWGEEKIGVVDLRSMRVTKRLPTAKPNGSAYAAPFRKVYVSNTLGNAVAVVDVDKDEIIKTLKIASATGMPQYDSVARKV